MMLADASTHSDDRAAIVVTGTLAAHQWEAHLGAREIEGHRSAWITPPIVSYSGWLETLWLASREPRARPLTPPQSLALWRRVIRESPEGRGLIGHRGAAEWAADAWRLLCHWRIDPARERATDSQSDFQAFLGWCRAYRRALAEHGWVDHAEIARQLPDAEWAAPSQVIFADLDEPSPVQHALLERLARAGTRIEQRLPPATTAELGRARFADATEELRAAIEWARRRLAANAAARIAIVVPGLAERRGEIERALSDRSASGDLADAAPAWHGGARLDSHPRLAAAANALLLTSRGATFEHFSRWLRSPFFGTDERSARAAFERGVRRDVRAQLPFVVACRDTALMDGLRRKIPLAANALAAALQETADLTVATPSRWARAWQRSLTALGWDGAADSNALSHWQSAIEDFARLTPIVGELAHEDALAELERGLERAAPEPMPLRGIHVLGRVDDVGPGYDAAWLTGFTDASWPEPARCNPLLPRALQRAHGMPWSTPQDARLRCARRLERLATRVPTLIASWPARLYDYETEPSPSIRAWPELAPAQLELRPRVASTRERTTIEDRPPPLPGTQLRGGVWILQRQARCPVRAFCEYRLGARQLERVSAGLSGRLRGTATHRALELLLEDLPKQSDLGRKAALIPSIVERALNEAFRDARRPLQALFAIEAERLSDALLRSLECDLERAPFTVAALEQKQTVAIAGRELSVRIDRLDSFADGSIAIIDYKTGNRASIKDWLAERPRDVQVPLYAAYAAAPIGATVIARVQPLAASYSGFWNPGTLYTHGRKLPDDRGWPQLAAQWRAAIEELVLELAGGDVRIFADDTEDALGAYAPLTRVHEQLALVRGSASRW